MRRGVESCRTCRSKPVGHILSDWCGRAQPVVGGATPGLLILASIRKQTEQTTESKPVSSTSLLLLHHICLKVPALTFFNDGLRCGCMREVNTFLSNLLLDIALDHSNSNLTRTPSGVGEETVKFP